jgi:hypothetical protein
MDQNHYALIEVTLHDAEAATWLELGQHDAHLGFVNDKQHDVCLGMDCRKPSGQDLGKYFLKKT